MKTGAAFGSKSLVKKLLGWARTKTTNYVRIPELGPFSLDEPYTQPRTVGEYLKDGFFGLNGPFGLSTPALDILWGMPAHLKPPALKGLQDEERRTGTRPPELQAFYDALEDLVFDLNQVYIGLCEKGYHALMDEHFPQTGGHADTSYRQSAML